MPRRRRVRFTDKVKRGTREVLGMVLSAVLGVVFTLLLTNRSVTVEGDAQKAYDATQAPFVTSVRADDTEPINWKMVLDRALTDDEIRTMVSLTDPSAVFSFLRGLGARPLAYIEPLYNAPAEYQQPFGRLELADAIKVSFLSTRTSSVIIDDWKVVDVDCGWNSAKTVVTYPPQGNAAYDGVRLHIPPKPSEPVLTEDVEGQGEPYFRNRYIEVGGGQSAGALRVEAIAPPGMTCAWGVEVHYSDAHQQEGRVLLEDRDGNAMRVHTVAAPENPDQNWVFGAVPWTDCHQDQSSEACLLLL